MKKKKETIDLESEQKVEIEAQEQTETAQQEVSEVEKLRAENLSIDDYASIANQF